MSDDEKQRRWVYGIVSTGVSLKELERRSERLPEVWVVEAGDLAAIVGNAPENDAKATRNQALAHAQVLEAAIVDASVVPFRFGMIVPGGDDQVRTELIQAHHDELAQLLERLEGRLQMVLKVHYIEGELLHEILDREPEIARLQQVTQGVSEEVGRNERVRLGELVNEAVEQQRQRDSAVLLERLKPLSIAVVVDALESEFMMLNAPFLLERSRMQEFEEAVEEVAREYPRIRFRLLGPMPAYNFLEELAWA
jgi:hypothetical protein